MMFAIDGISIPDCKLAREMTELVRDTETTYSRLRFALLVGLGALLCACSDRNSTQADPAAGAAGYREGYAEGCQIGITNGWRDRVSADDPGVEDKPSRYADDHDFRSGWKAGRKLCFESTMSPQ